MIKIESRRLAFLTRKCLSIFCYMANFGNTVVKKHTVSKDFEILRSTSQSERLACDMHVFSQILTSRSVFSNSAVSFLLSQRLVSYKNKLIFSSSAYFVLSLNGTSILSKARNKILCLIQVPSTIDKQSVPMKLFTSRNGLSEDTITVNSYGNIFKCSQTQK